MFTAVSNVSALSIDQRVEPAIVLGGDLADFIGTPVGEIWVYAYNSGIWDQIPFQLDERNDTTDSYFVDAQNGFLDSNDEIVFMPEDAGEIAPAISWVPETEPERYEITVTDPIDASMRFAYIYSSSIITQTFTEDYVSFNPTTQVITAIDYTIGFDDVKIGIMDEIRVNTSIGGDNTNLLDRMKYRLQVTIIIPFLFDEEDFDYTMVGYKDGPVRFVQQIGTGDFVNLNFAYKSYAIATQEMVIDTSPDWVRVSLDFLSTATPMTYYDSNSNVMTINGVLDTPSSTTPPTWVEVTGASGTLVIPRDLTQVGGNPSLYYVDDLSSNDAPESESGEFGDSGIYITNPPNGNPSTFISFYFLPPNQGNVGSTYDNYVNNPISVNALAQLVDSSPLPEIIDITVFPDPQEVFDFVNISSDIIDNYEVYGAWVGVIDPEGNPVGNFSMSNDPISGNYYDNRTYDIVGAYQFTIWTNDTYNNWNSSSGQFLIQDTNLPGISGITKIPDPQEVMGFVNVSVVVVDNYELYGVWIDIEDPDGLPVQTFSMSFDSISGRYFLNMTYDIVGTYQFLIYTNDTSDNWNSSFGQFELEDTTRSSIIDITAIPDPQEVKGYVNISAIIEDNYELDGAWLEISDPNNDPVGNSSMNYDAGTNRYYLHSTFDMIGIYQFTIWTRDTQNNWNLSSGQFQMRDTTSPNISDITALPGIQEVNGLVDISAMISDNYGLGDVWVNITGPGNKLLGNYSMVFETSRFHLEQTYDLVGTYQFKIWARDSSNNWNSSSGQFQVKDTTEPEISDLDVFPDPQDIGGFVNISAVVSDIVGMDGVWVTITDPSDDIVGNFSMSYDPVEDRYYENRGYDVVGDYGFIIWSKDTSDNWKSKSGEFTIRDSQPPKADSGSDQAVYVGTTVTFDGSGSSDNVKIVEYEWTFTDGSLQSLSGSSPFYTFDNIFNFKVTLTVYDAEGNKDSDIMWVNVTIIPDTIAPTIIHAPVTTATAGKKLTISAEITDDNEVIEAILFYWTTGESGYNEVPMTNTGGNEWTADIPSWDMTEDGIEYFIFATDGINNATEPAGSQYPVTVKNGGTEEEGFPFLILSLVIIVIVALLLIVLFLMKKKGKGETVRDGPVVDDTVEMGS